MNRSHAPRPAHRRAAAAVAVGEQIRLDDGTPVIEHAPERFGQHVVAHLAGESHAFRELDRPLVARVVAGHQRERPELEQ